MLSPRPLIAMAVVCSPGGPDRGRSVGACGRRAAFPGLQYLLQHHQPERVAHPVGGADLLRDYATPTPRRSGLKSWTISFPRTRNAHTVTLRRGYAQLRRGISSEFDCRQSFGVNAGASHAARSLRRGQNQSPLRHGISQKACHRPLTQGVFGLSEHSRASKPACSSLWRVLQAGLMRLLTPILPPTKH